jgi:hypothetical protein
MLHHATLRVSRSTCVTNPPWSTASIIPSCERELLLASLGGFRRWGSGAGNRDRRVGDRWHYVQHT